jgi:hypothetical protein
VAINLKVCSVHATTPSLIQRAVMCCEDLPILFNRLPVHESDGVIYQADLKLPRTNSASNSGRDRNDDNVITPLKSDHAVECCVKFHHRYRGDPTKILGEVQRPSSARDVTRKYFPYGGVHVRQSMCHTLYYGARLHEKVQSAAKAFTVKDCKTNQYPRSERYDQNLSLLSSVHFSIV